MPEMSALSRAGISLVGFGAARYRANGGFRPGVGRNWPANPLVSHDAILRSARGGRG